MDPATKVAGLILIYKMLYSVYCFRVWVIVWKLSLESWKHSGANKSSHFDFHLSCMWYNKSCSLANSLLERLSKDPLASNLQGFHSLLLDGLHQTGSRLSFLQLHQGNVGFCSGLYCALYGGAGYVCSVLAQFQQTFFLLPSNQHYCSYISLTDSSVVYACQERRL